MPTTASAQFVSIGSPLDLLKNKAEFLIEESSVGYGRRGGARYDQGRFEEVIADFEEGLKLDPAASSLWLLKAFAHRKQGNIEDAKRAYIAAADLLDKNNPQFANRIRRGLQSITAL